MPRLAPAAAQGARDRRRSRNHEPRRPRGPQANGDGHLWSIDLEHLYRRLHGEIGAAVPEPLRRRWTYVSGTSRSRLRPLLEAIGEIDLFVHDSLHTGRNVRFELETVWPALRPGGALVVDDIGHSLAFDAFTAAVAPCARLTARHAHGGGYWGVVLKGVPGEEAPTGCGSASPETAAAAGRA